MKILIAEDDSGTRSILKKIAEEHGYETIEAKNGYDACKIFKKENADIYIAIIDWLIPEIDGIKFCKYIRNSCVEHYVYVLFLTSKRNIEDIVKGLDAGGDDYMTKPFSRREFIARIRVARRFVDLEHSLSEANKELKILATTDSLTGMLNRRCLMERLKNEIFRAAREKKSCCLIMIDIDHFKMVNDTLGHKAGDKVLVEIAARIMAELRPYDVVGRYGGEEFLIGIPCADVKKGMNVAERIRVSIFKKPFQAGSDKELKITASLGVTSVIPITDEDNVELILDAIIGDVDKALYMAKESGRNRVFVKK